jgi:predicted Zn-dependent peptidase
MSTTGRTLRVVLVVALTCVGTTAAVQALPPDAPHPNDMVFGELEFDPPEPTRFELDNGLVVFFLEDHGLPLVSVRALVRTGAIYERTDRSGLAGLVGAVMRSGGSERRPPELLDELLADMASVVETWIGQERAVADVSALARHFEETVILFADILQHPAFRDEKLEIARARAIEALRRQNDNPRAVAEREHRALIYGRHPYGRTATVTTLRAIQRQDLVEFHQRFFRPNNTVLAVAGAVSLDELRRVLDATFGRWERATVEFPAVPNVPPVPSVPAPSVQHIEMDLPQSAIRIGHLGLDRYDDDRYAVTVLNHILGGGFTSRLIGRLRVEEGIAYSVWSEFTLPRDTGVFVATTQTRTDQTVRAIRLMIEEISRLREDGVTEEEFADARSAILNSDIFRYVTPTQIVRQVAALEFDGFPLDQLQRAIAAYEAMSIEDVDAAARRYLHPDGLVMLAVGKAADLDTTLSVLGPLREIELETIE